MSLKTINRKSICPELTDWPLGFIKHHFADMSSKEPKYSFHQLELNWRRHRNKTLTWLHKSGHWVLCGEDHWSGYRPVQTHYWYLRTGNWEHFVRKVTDRRTRSHTVTYLSSIYPPAGSERQFVSVTPLCVPCHRSRCGKRQHIKLCVTQLTAWEHSSISSAPGKTAQQLYPSPHCTWLNTSGDIWHWSETLRKFDKMMLFSHSMFILAGKIKFKSTWTLLLMFTYLLPISFQL